MNHPSHPSRNSMSWDVLTFGNNGIELNRAFERRAEEQARNQMAARLETPTLRGPVRAWIGAALITVGRAIAGPAPSPDPNVAGQGAA